MRLIIAACCACLLFSCTASKRSTGNSNISSLRLLGEYQVPFGLSYNNTTVGGLSGIDYDRKLDCYYLISDDRSSINPARFYTANITVTNKGIDTVYFTDVKFMRQPNGQLYPNNKQDPFNTPDPEAMRHNAKNGQLVWSSEGERIIRTNETVISDPAIRIVDTEGNFIDSFPLPSNLHMQVVEKGPRQNSVFEGLSFANDYKTLFVSVEEPLYEDGPRADTIENNAYIRILKYDVESRKALSQYAYKLSKVAYTPDPRTAYKINGIPDILSLSDDKMLVIERSFSTGRLACTVKVFIADLSAATDISTVQSLSADKNFKPASKKLLLNMDDLGIYIDNIEGVTFGPTLPNGHKTLLFVADNNFNPLEKSQLLLFEVVE